MFSGRPIQHGDDQQHGEVERIEPRHARHGEVAELARGAQVRAAAIDMREDVAGDQEEQIDEGPAPAKEPAGNAAKEVAEPVIEEDLQVISGDDARGDPPQSVKPRQTGNGRGVAGDICARLHQRPR